MSVSEIGGQLALVKDATECGKFISYILLVALLIHDTNFRLLMPHPGEEAMLQRRKSGPTCIQAPPDEGQRRWEYEVRT